MDCNSVSMHDLTESTNLKSLQNWLPRRVMCAWRIAGMVHALEGWNEHECGDIALDLEKAWSTANLHGFHPVSQV
jgi:aldehyde decarbonylase